MAGTMRRFSWESRWLQLFLTEAQTERRRQRAAPQRRSKGEVQASHLPPPPWGPRELCGEARLSGRHSRTTRGRELKTTGNLYAAHVGRRLVVVVFALIFGGVPLFRGPNSLWNTPNTWPYPGASWALTAA